MGRGLPALRGEKKGSGKAPFLEPSGRSDAPTRVWSCPGREPLAANIRFYFRLLTFKALIDFEVVLSGEKWIEVDQSGSCSMRGSPRRTG